MLENLRVFGEVAPDAAQFQVQGRARPVTPDARDGVLDFLLENGKGNVLRPAPGVVVHASASTMYLAEIQAESLET
jgi:hypothetical protein